MSKSILYAANTNTQTVNAGGVINFGSIVRRYGCNVTLSGGNAEVTGCGYYDIDTNFTFVPSTAGNITIAIYKDGVIIPGAEATLTTVATDTYSVSIPAVIKQNCNCTDTITVVVSGVGAVFSNASIVVDKM